MIKDLGQNFLADREVLNDIIVASELTRDDVVLEIGPGHGVLTEALAKRVKQVIAVELDRTLVAELQKKFRAQKNVTIVHDDILRFNIATFKNLNIEKFKVVANLPYGITSRVLRMFLDPPSVIRHPPTGGGGGGQQPTLIIVMVQKEVAERVCALPGGMSMLSVSVQYYATPTIVRLVPRTAFDPTPKVDSAILKILPSDKEQYRNILIRTKVDQEFFRLVGIGFSSRRKQLQNLLASGLRIPSDEIKKALHELHFPPTVRAQELSIAAWIALTKRFSSV